MDVVFPEENEEEFLKAAEQLGIHELCFVYDDLSSVKRIAAFQPKSRIKLHAGIVCSPVDVMNYKKKAEFVFVDAADYPDKIRETLEHARPDVVFNLERAARHDFMHHRASGLNQVHCELMAKNSITLGLSLSSILNSVGRDRAMIMGRMAQNLRLARKYKLNVLFASFARSPYDLRARKELESLQRVLF